MMDESDDGSSADDIQGGAKQKRLEEPPEKTSTDLIVLGIPFKTTSETARAYFETFGEVVMFDVSYINCCDVLFSLFPVLNCEGRNLIHLTFVITVFKRSAFNENISKYWILDSHGLS